MPQSMWRTEDNLQELVLPFNHEDCGDWTKIAFFFFLKIVYIYLAASNSQRCDRLQNLWLKAWAITHEAPRFQDASKCSQVDKITEYHQKYQHISFSYINYKLYENNLTYKNLGIFLNKEENDHYETL